MFSGVWLDSDIYLNTIFSYSPWSCVFAFWRWGKREKTVNLNLKNKTKKHNFAIILCLYVLALTVIVCT